VFLDRTIPLAPSLAALLSVAAVVIVVADRRAVVNNDRAARLQLAAIELGRRAALLGRA